MIAVDTNVLVHAHHGVDELWTTDRDFSWFPELQPRNPLV